MSIGGVTSADGIHAGWLEVGRLPGERVGDVSVLGQGYQPSVLEAIQVGETFNPQPSTNSDVVRTALVLSEIGGVEAIVEVRRWTNSTTGAFRTTETITSCARFEWLALNAELNGTNVLVPLPMPERALVPSNAPAPAAWLSATNTLLLYEESQSSGEASPTRRGPLTEHQPLFLAYRRLFSMGAGTGSIRFPGGAAPPQASWASYGFPAVGEPPPLPSERITARIDVDGDGLIDYETRELSGGCSDSSRWLITYLQPLGTNALLLQPASTSQGFWPDPTIAGLQPGTVLGDGPLSPSGSPAAPPTWRGESGNLFYYSGAGMGSHRYSLGEVL